MDRQRKPLLVTIDDTVILTKEVLTDRCLDALFESFSYLPFPELNKIFILFNSVWILKCLCPFCFSALIDSNLIKVCYRAMCFIMLAIY